MGEVRPGDEENRVGMRVVPPRQACELGVPFNTAPATHKLAYNVKVLRIEGQTTGLQLQIHSPYRGGVPINSSM